MAHGQRVKCSRQRTRSQHQGAPEVGDEQDGAAAQAVRPSAGEEAKDEDGGGAGAAEQPHLERRCFENEDGGERQTFAADPGPHLGDRLPYPEFQEVRVSPNSVPRHLI